MRRADRRPVVVGKADERGQKLLKSDGELTPYEIASALVARFGLEAFSERTRQRFDALKRRAGRQMRNEAGMARVPYFCSGCPHNSSTKVPDGSMAMAGIGCHTLAIGMERNTKTFTHMGAEGATWVGASHFTDMPHVFQNLGDGTYFHSGYMAIRHAVATNTTITYKILYNDAVAMTGGQPHDGNVHPWTISQQVHAEGVRRIALVSDEPDKYPIGTEWAPGVTFHHRDQLDEVQRDLREYKGVSVLIYDQTCAAEKRRRRKRGTLPDPNKRVFINQARLLERRRRCPAGSRGGGPNGNRCRRPGSGRRAACRRNAKAPTQGAAFGTHVGEGLGVALHANRERVAADAGHRHRALGHLGRAVVRAAGAEIGHAGHAGLVADLPAPCASGHRSAVGCVR